MSSRESSRVSFFFGRSLALEKKGRGKKGKLTRIDDRPRKNSLPDIKTKRYIFKIHTSRMSLSSDVDLEEFVHTKDELSGADIKAVCTEAGLLALRERRMRVMMADLRSAREKVLYKKKSAEPEGLYL